ncbi:MAG: hypothetical protein AAGH64_07275, partial [Planctomycetota bacterium]
ENLEEAERMTMIAVSKQPGNHSFLDSLAWARYKLGKLEDTRTQRGAVSLLQEAFRTAQTLDDRTSSPVLGDHLGDALWAAGRTEEALRVWEDALPLAGSLLLGFNIEPDADRASVPPVLLTYVDLHGALVAKVDAARAGRQPPIAPPHGPGYTPPADDAP